MDLATLIGIVSAFALVLYSISNGSGLGLFLDLHSAMIVVGGTFGATMINYPLRDVIGVFKVIRNVFFSKSWDGRELIARFVDFSKLARKEGLLSLEKELRLVDDPFLEKAVRLAIDGVEPASIQGILSSEMDSIEERHRSGADILNTMANFFPAMGMIGTLIGLIQMLKTIEDPSTIGPGMAVALITTFYGAVAANMICLPMAGKLRKRSQEELHVKEMVVAGAVSLAIGDNPRIMEQKLHSFLPPKSRESAFD